MSRWHPHVVFNRKKYFDAVRATVFGGKLTQQQVDGQNYILSVWENTAMDWELRWLAYALATTMHETASTMWPIAEYGKGKGQPYGVPDPETKQTYYGRGFVQLTWRENYARADKELGFTGTRSCEYYAENALRAPAASAIMFQGMHAGWFRGDSKGRHTFERYFDDDTDDPYNAREIVNGDKNTKPSWAKGATIAELIGVYYEGFLNALERSLSIGPRKKLATLPT